MAQKERSLFKFILFISILFVQACNQPSVETRVNVFEEVAISKIPNTSISENDTLLKLLNGVYYYNDKPYSGFIKSVYPTDTLMYLSSYLQGRQHGATKTYFANGKLATERNYKNGVGYGRHFGYWENGNLKFDFIYFNDKREGPQKQWYESGSKYYEMNYKDDKEDGMQKAWRENGKPYINYEVRNGERFGLQKSALCYTLKEESLLKSNDLK